MAGRRDICWCIHDNSHSFKIWEAFCFVSRNVFEEVQEVDDTHSEEDEGSSEDEDNSVNREKQVLYSSY